MNNYPEWWDTTLTVYNKFVDPQTQVVTWYRTVVEQCFWKDTGSKVLVGNVTLDGNYIICRIPVDERYVSPGDWRNLGPELRAGCFTLQPDDIIIKGEVSDTVDEGVSGSRATDLIKKYKKLGSCTQVNTVTDNTGGGRGDEHYSVKGI